MCRDFVRFFRSSAAHKWNSKLFSVFARQLWRADMTRSHRQAVLLMNPDHKASRHVYSEVHLYYLISFSLWQPGLHLPQSAWERFISQKTGVEFVFHRFQRVCVEETLLDLEKKGGQGALANRQSTRACRQPEALSGLRSVTASRV